jgi:2-oxo-4-hydroxy-4-carboxy--5-ureidoimidazoline (OHCU) decarboxylase
VRELPRKLTVGQLEELFEGRTALVERLAEIENPLGGADEVVRTLTEDQKLEALDAHPAIGQRDGVSARSATEQGSDDDPALLAELAELNRRYEEQFGFRFVVFVNRRPKAEIVPILHERLARTRDEELDTGLSELVAIARDRWRRG